MNKNVVKKIVCFILFIVMCYLFIYFGSKNYDNEVNDNIKFSNEYSDVSTNNLYKYITADKVLEILNNKESAIVFMAFSSNTWSHYYANLLNDVALLRKVDQVYYYNFQKDRSFNNRTYISIVKNLSPYLYKNDLGKESLSAPTIMIIKNGEITYFNNEVSYIKGNVSVEEYFDDYKKNILISELDKAIVDYLGE